MTDRHLHRIGLLLLAIFSFVVYNWIFGYVIVLQYQTNYCFFVFSREFLMQFLDRPGGLLAYAGRFLGQFYHYPWLGALIVSALVTCFGAALFVVLKRLRRTVSIFHTFFPCTLLLVLHHFVKDGTIGLLVTCVAFLGYLSLRGAVSRRVYALVVTLALYLAIGAYFWLFVVWVTASEWLDSPLPSNLAFKLLYPALAVCVPLAAYRWLFPVALRSAFIWPTDLVVSYSVVDFTLCAFLLLTPFWARASTGRRLGSFLGSRRGMAIQAALLVLIAVSLLCVRYDSNGAGFAEYHQLYKRRQWDAILDKAKRNPSGQQMTQFFTNSALYHKGKLLEEMFDYPQVWGTRGLVLPFFLKRSQKLEQTDLYRAMYNSDLFFEMGHMNAAFRHAYNQMAALGETYDNLRRMAECNMVNGNYGLAEKSLNILERTLFHKESARHYKNIISDSSAADRCFPELRKRLPAVELDMYGDEFVPILTLLKSNAANRMALDYLTAWCLLDRTSVPMIAENLHYFKEAGYTAIPAHCQEALMVSEKTSGNTVGKHDFAYDPDVASRFKRFDQQMSLYRDKHIAQSELRATFGGTYMYYYIFAATPRENHSLSHWMVGNAFYSQGMPDDAVRHYRHTLRYEPDFAEAHAKLGDVLTSQGKAEEADFHYREALRLRRQSGEARKNLGQTSLLGTDRGE